MFAQPVPAAQLFRNHCGTCHGDDARGGAKAPGLVMNRRVAEQTTAQLRAFLERGSAAAGMPAFADLPAADLASLAGYLRSLNVDTILSTVPPPDAAPKVTWGAPQPGDWLTYNGNDTGNRYSSLKQITTANIASLKLKWVFPIDYFGLEVTPLEADGVMYVTGPSQVYALNAVTGAPLWHYSRPVTPGLQAMRSSAPIAAWQFFAIRSSS